MNKNASKTSGAASVYFYGAYYSQRNDASPFDSKAMADKIIESVRKITDKMCNYGKK